jgi:hypothetical protein
MVGAVVLTTLLAPAAQAAGTGQQSTTCAFAATLKFKPGLVHGFNRLAFIKLTPHLTGCTGGTVASADGYGGSLGDLRCNSGRVFQRASAKAMLYWNTGATSGLNFWFEFSRSKLHGVVTDGLFKGEHFKTKFSLTPTRGDCAASPLLRAKIAGTLGF